jgi:ABC transport system ATP-binding/permease protein
MSKLAILFTISAIQTFCFVLIGNLVLGISDMLFPFWLVLFSVSCFANVLGLNISSAFNSAVTVYILIPLLLIPQMILSGLLFPFDKLNNSIGNRGQVPVVADMMASRWAYEAMATYQFKNNQFSRFSYPLEADARMADFKSNYWVDKLKEALRFVESNRNSEEEAMQKQVAGKFRLLQNELGKEPLKLGLAELPLGELSPATLTPAHFKAIEQYLAEIRLHYIDEYQLAEMKQEKLVSLRQQNEEGFDVNTYKNRYFNDAMSDLVRNVGTEDRILEQHGELVQLIDPIYQVPNNPKHALDYRAHFFAPQKHFLGQYYDTFFFNIVVIWLMSALLYLLLYAEGIRRLLAIFAR